MPKADRDIVAAKFGAAHGLKGWLKLHAFTESVEHILEYQPWYIQSPRGELSLVCDSHRFQGQQLVVHLRGFDTREAIEPFVNQAVLIKAKQLPRLPKGEYYWQDLIGLRVTNLEGCELGTVMSMMATGANDVLMLDGDQQRCLPYLLKRVIKQIDLDQGSMLVDWPAEL